MKAQVGNTGDEVEIGQYREVNKGALKAFFSMVEYPAGAPHKARKTLDCRYFVQGDSCWIAFPQKEVKYTDGRKSDFIPYISYMDKTYAESLKAALISLLKSAKPQEKHEQAQGNTNQWKKAPVQNNSSSDWGDAPF